MKRLEENNLDDEAKYFCGILPDDENIIFWSNHFNEYVCRLFHKGEILPYYYTAFMQSQGSEEFLSQTLTSENNFSGDTKINYLPQ